MHLYLPVYHIKDTDEQPDEEILRVKFRRILSPGASVPMELRCVILVLDVFTNSVKRLSKSPTFGIFYEGFIT